MAEWIKHRVDVRLTGRITQIPDSQKVFGALVHLYAEYTSSDQATALVTAIKASSKGFMLSNLLPKGYFPVPHNYIFDKLSGKDREPDKKYYKTLKKCLFAPVEQIELMISNPENLPNSYIVVEQTQQIHAAIDSKRYNIPALAPNLYSVPEIVVREVSTIKDENLSDSQLVRDFSFYISMEKCKEYDSLLNTLVEAVNASRLLILGPRSSQGMNTFELIEIQEEDYESSSGTKLYLNLGMLLPRNINFSKSSLKLFTSERRPFSSQAGWDKTSMNGQFISFIESGSVVCVEQGLLQTAGTCVTAPNRPNEIVFGRAFLHPLMELEAKK